MESMMASFMTEQDRQAQEQDRRVAQQADSAAREHGKLPSKPDLNPRESVNAITLRGGKQLEMLPAQTTRSPATKLATDFAPTDEEMPREAES
ncbi:unnamed protein product [Rhodiola kirilowii]